MLSDSNFFTEEKRRLKKKKDEDLWQQFFEDNYWIFGFGLQYIINVPLEKKKLEQVVAGFSIKGNGKRTDALMKSKGIISSLCFAEIKKHSTPLLDSDYRPGSFPPAKHLRGGIAQLQKTIQKSLYNIGDRLKPKDKDGNPTREELFLYRPKAFLLIGKLDEFNTENGINEEKYSSFELYRKSIKDIEIITFDELLERAKFIVNTSSS